MFDQSPRQLLETLARVNRTLKDRAIELRRLAGVKSVQTSLEIVSNQSGPLIEGYLEVSFGKSDWACWFLDASCNADSWTIDAKLDRESGTGPETLYEIPTRVIDNFEDFAVALEQTVHELLTQQPIIPKFLT